MLTPAPPILETDFYLQHGQLLCDSYRRWTGKSLLDTEATSEERIEYLFHAPYALLSHGTEADPIFNFGSLVALQLFELDWAAFTRLPSRKSAEPMNRDERARLLERVTRYGYIDDYEGIRISATGQRFVIQQATVWNLVDAHGVYRGQAALFDHWQPL
ncbi:MEKHLA domain-containing protein [Catalinimonas alkaloidigena]|uniref:MEKHLA domain-containing protein n=1 Tax=Catalinimonas alkaloidigena TaxID=1075417 RepID=A0A1G9SZ11_9BACT|nr:MEKHLA domain-containing protein [Catalinimonas alkaloidigena]SDM40567.1 MEKHLA domain-containing protein [Catalinimonas alkaloidigena]